jgi:hypothetical protein
MLIFEFADVMRKGLTSLVSLAHAEVVHDLRRPPATASHA